MTAAFLHLKQARALVLSGAPDVPETYNSVMNAIFSAQKAGVLVDCAVLGESSTFLQQAAYLTGETTDDDVFHVFCFWATVKLRGEVLGRVVLGHNTSHASPTSFGRYTFRGAPWCTVCMHSLVRFVRPDGRSVTGAR